MHHVSCEGFLCRCSVDIKNLQCSIQNRNVHISVLNKALWDMEQVHSGICEIGLFITEIWDYHISSSLSSGYWSHMNGISSQITDKSIVCLTSFSHWQQRKYQRFLLVYLSEGNLPVTGGFPSQRVSAESVSMWWHLHGYAQRWELAPWNGNRWQGYH